MKSKQCSGKHSRCGLVKPIEEFQGNGKGWRPACKACCKLAYENNRSHHIARTNAYNKKNRKARTEYNNRYYSVPENDERRRSLNRKRKPAINAYQNKRRKDPAIKLRLNISSTIAHVLASRKTRKSGSFLKAVPYTMAQLKEHLEKQFASWMSWSNYGGAYKVETWNDNDPSTWTWQLDHIIPQSDLPYTSIEEANFQKTWALSNLRPLSAKQNCFDGARRTRHYGQV